MNKLKNKKIAAGILGMMLMLSLIAGDFSAPASAQTMTDASASASVLTQFNRNLTIGSSGADVAALQTILVSGGYLVMPQGVAKGYFGPLTRSAVARWQAAVGISPAAGYFGPISRSRINAAVVVTPPANPCPTGYTASGMNPVICMPSSTGGNGTTTDPGNNNNDNQLRGGEATLSRLNMRDGENDRVKEGEAAEVAEIEFRVENGDIRIDRIDLTFTSDNNNQEDEPWDAITNIRLLANGREIADEDVSDEDDWLRDRSPYVFRFSGINHIIRQGTNPRIVVEVESANGIVSSNQIDRWTLFVDTNGIRGTDAAGIQQYIGNSSEITTFEIVDASVGDELSVRHSADNPDATVLEVSDNSRSDYYTVLSFELQADERDIAIRDIPIVLETASSSVGRVINNARIEIDGKTYSRYRLSSDNGTSSVMTFDIDRQATVRSNRSATVNIMLSFNAANGSNYMSGETIQASVVGANITARGANNLNATGNATGEVHTLATEGVIVAPASITTRTIGTNSTQAAYTFNIDVKAFENDAYIKLAASEGTVENNAGFNVVFLDGNNNVVTTGTSSFTVSANKSETSSGFVRVNENQTVRFTVQAFFDPAVSGVYKAQLYSVNFNDANADADEQYVLTPVSSYRSGGEYVNEM
jgi:peptidoglycan hydrolase-like protein with peptidoglycan-binding domain